MKQVGTKSFLRYTYMIMASSMCYIKTVNYDHMKNKMTINYFQKIREYMSPGLFQSFSKELYVATEKELEALWTIIAAGYPIGFALSNYKNLNEYIKGKNLKYTDALKIIYTLYPGLDAGIHVKRPAWFEFN